MTVVYVSGRLHNKCSLATQKHSYQFTTKPKKKSPKSSVCLFVCLSISLLCLVHHSSFYCFSFLVLLFVPSVVYVCLGVSGCSTSSSSWLFQEMHLIVLGSEVSYLPSGHRPPLTPPLPPPHFFFLISFISCLQEAKLHCAQKWGHGPSYSV